MEEFKMEYIKENGTIWDERSENNDTWSIPVTSEMIELARKGNWSILLTPTKSVPLNWFPEKLHEKKILCLASSGYIWGHSLEDQIQGQIEAGFAIIGFYEDIGGTALDNFINSSMATKAIKL